MTSSWEGERKIPIYLGKSRNIEMADVCRHHGVCDATVCKWGSKYGGMAVSDAKRLKGPEGRTALSGFAMEAA